MSDFLANLVERTLMPDLVVQPKLLTPYERHTTSIVAFEPLAEEIDEEFTGEAPGNIHTTAVNHSERHPERHSSMRQEVEVPALHESSLPKAGPEFEVLTPHPTVRQTEVAIEVPSPKESQPGSPKAVQITKPARSSETASIGSVARPLLKLDRPSRRENTIVQHSQSLNRQSQRSREDNIPAAAPSSITIRIGRVEVRASLPASTHAASRPASGQPRSVERPSLNDYLEQRSRGGKS